MKRFPIMLAATALMTLPALMVPATASQADNADGARITGRIAPFQLAAEEKITGAHSLKEQEKKGSERPEQSDNTMSNPTGAASTGPRVKHEAAPPVTNGTRPEVTDNKVTNPSVK